jgi:hypothetical protein
MKNEDNIWQLYMDDQLNKEQRHEYEKSLTDAQKKNVENERRFYKIIAEKISSDQYCPEHLWDNIKDNIARQPEAVKVKRRFILSAAAVILLLSLLSVVLIEQSVAKPINVSVQFDKDIEDIKTEIEVMGPRQDVQEYLHNNGFMVDIGDIQACSKKHNHMIEMGGISQVKVNGIVCRCVKLYYACCSQPVFTYIVDMNQKQEFKFTVDVPDTKWIENTLGNYRIVTISPHHSGAVADLYTLTHTDQ